jgi:hypothetical protein
MLDENKRLGNLVLAVIFGGIMFLFAKYGNADPMIAGLVGLGGFFAGLFGGMGHDHRVEKEKFTKAKYTEVDVERIAALAVQKAMQEKKAA